MLPTFLYPIVDGNWGQWSNWTECDKPCGVGFQNRSRVCDDPAPAHGGNDCNGTHTNETQMCNFNYCPGTCVNKLVTSPNYGIYIQVSRNFKLKFLY